MVIKTFLLKINVSRDRKYNEIEFKSSFFKLDALVKSSFIHKLFFKFNQVKMIIKIYCMKIK